MTVEYEDRKPKRINTVVISTQHDPAATLNQIREEVITHVIQAVLPAEWLDASTTYHVNPTGRFVVGGPQGDCGLTGRKIIVDTYGGMGRHGGGAFSGKDPTKVDRSASYMARYVAKNVVSAGLAERVEIQLAYAIGVADPVSVLVDSFGTGVISDAEISGRVRDTFQLTPRGIMESLQLRRPIYEKTASYGHFGREEPEFTWKSLTKWTRSRGERDRLLALRPDLQKHPKAAKTKYQVWEPRRDKRFDAVDSSEFVKQLKRRPIADSNHDGYSDSIECTAASSHKRKWNCDDCHNDRDQREREFAVQIHSQTTDVKATLTQVLNIAAQFGIVHLRGREDFFLKVIGTVLHL